MNELIAEWVSKAEDDYVMAGRGLMPGEPPIADGVCFHAQQCVEKYLKAFLTGQRIPFPRIHTLTLLLDLCLPFDAQFDSLRPELATLQNYAIAVRYPGFAANEAMAQAALDTAQHTRTFIRSKLTLT